ncbi:ragulator complex protein LAMTOR3-A [Nilaparvata lugens]|uniref:ragulator complex protein LAMTOR3-A n=1 Tax=Nilaparvata lugens TaxID=108931 RepID=UPI000B98A938|nr:ragulator complex protein LAMTOR3-A [Nilaparvata lugens]
MGEEIKRFLTSLLHKVEGLYCIAITDRDGVPMIKVTSDKMPEMAVRPSFLSTFAMATDQGSKLGLGTNKSVICMYSTYQVVQLNNLPFIVSFVASTKCNTGHILALDIPLQELLYDLRTVIEP